MTAQNVFDRNRVVALRGEGLSHREIANRIGRCPSYVGYTLKRWEEDHSVEDRERSGRPRIFDARDERRLMRQLEENREQTAAEVKKEVFGRFAPGCDRTVRNIFRRQGYHKYLADVVPSLTYLQQLRRRRFSRVFRHYNWHKVVFSDEKRFSKRPDGPIKVWRRAGESRNPKCTRKRTKFGGGGIMVWGAISSTRVFPLIRIEGTLNADEYIVQILTKFVPKLSRATSKRVIFMQDGATPHTAAKSKA